METPEKEVGATTSPTRRINIQFNGSDLYDSYEFRQMTHQLNMVMQASSSPAYVRDKMKKVVEGSNAASPSYLFRLNSPLYRHQMNRIYRESARTPRKISGQKAADKGPCRRRTRVKGFVARLWMKVKQGFLGSNGETDGISK
ncbi:hypothetical protein K1719_011311 [Acacia pycnantha]|nr:hypothetical protein K1719_011311 [Acacia pycnantha]